MAGGTTQEEEVLVFDRTPVARLISCASVFGSAALLFDYISEDPVRPIAVVGLILLVIGTLFSALLQYGDHIYLSSEGLLYKNKLLPMFRSERWMRWEEIAEVREIRRKILVLLAYDGRRLLVDAIGGYAIARREILKRVPRAALSTMERFEAEAKD